MAKYVRLPPATVLSRNNEKGALFSERVRKHVNRWQLSQRDLKRLNALLGCGSLYPQLLMSDVTARIESSTALMRCIDNYFEEFVGADQQVYHITFVDDIGLASDRKPILNRRAFRRKVDKAIRSMGLSGIVHIEIQTLVNYPAKGKGRTLMLHAHGVCWGRVSRRKFRKAKAKLNASRSWSNIFGAKPIKSRKLKSGREDAMRMASYISKLPHDAKYLAPCHAKPDQYRFKPTLNGYPTNLAVRVMEGLSHYRLEDAVFGVNEGKTVRREWKSHMRKWHLERAERSPVTAEFNVAKLWRQIRKAARHSYYRPFKIR